MGALGVGLVTLIMFACAAQTSLSGPGQECFAATDCQDGLVCVPQRGGARLCSDDLSQVTGRPPPEAGAAAEAGGDGPNEANPTDSPVQQDTSMPDTSMPDTSMPPADAGADG
ncbi:MAG: hypothetical protein QOI41_4869 [Myxococcales bacterium]|nr:hypothetical protein [Myxococcales bacterium]